MKVDIKIESDNDAFTNPDVDWAEELGAVLGTATVRVAEAATYLRYPIEGVEKVGLRNGTLLDSNGNTVGTWRVEL
jgi:hypothetical protein